jgi:hypothetical protein
MPTPPEELKAILALATSPLDGWMRITGILTPDQFRTMLESGLNLMVLLEAEFERRFPAECAAWQAQHDDP